MHAYIALLSNVDSPHKPYNKLDIKYINYNASVVSIERCIKFKTDQFKCSQV